MLSFYSAGPDPKSSGVDAFIQPWPKYIYAFPPINLISKFLLHFIKQKIQLGIVITPYWPAQTFFPILLDLLIEHPILFSADKLEACHSLIGPRHLSKFLASAISCNPEKKKDFKSKLRSTSSSPLNSEHSVHTLELGASLPIGLTQGGLVIATYQ